MTGSGSNRIMDSRCSRLHGLRGLCASAIMQTEPWVLPDTKLDPRSLANPLVAEDFGLRFYVGIPLRTSDSSISEHFASSTANRAR